MQGLDSTSARASEPEFEPVALRSINLNSRRSTSSKQSLVRHRFTFTQWIGRLRPLAALAGIVYLIRLFHGTTCKLQHESAGQLLRYYCTPWHQIASALNPSRPLPSISEESSTTYDCETSLCFDEDIGARIVNNEITHLTNILNLLDGCGRPFDQVFDPEDRRWKAALKMRRLENDVDSISVEFTSGIVKFVSNTRRLDNKLVDTVWAVVRRFKSGFVVEQQIRRALKQFRDVQSARQAKLQEDLSVSQRRLYAIETDHLIHTTVATLVGNLSSELDQIMPQIRDITFFVEPLGSQGAQIVVDLDNEVPRVTEILKGVSWWQTWSTWSGIWRYNQVEYLEDYLQHLTSKGPDLRLLVEDVQIVTENLRTLHEYCQWYLGREPTDLLKGFSSTNNSVPLDDIAFALDKFFFEVDLITADTLRQIGEVPPRRPHRVRLIAVPSVL